MSVLNDTTVNGVITQSEPAVADADLIRLGEAKALMTALFQGDWNNTTNYTAGQLVKESGSIWAAKINNVNKQPSTNPTEWQKLLDSGTAGAAAYVYIAYADASDGTGFTNTFNTSKNYIAIKPTTSPITTPVQADFAGLWKNYQGGTSAVTSVNTLTGAVVLTTANITENTNLYYTDARVRACTLTGLSTVTGGAIGTGDSVLSAFGKAENRLEALEAAMPTLSGTAPITYSAGVIGINASSANTVNYVVQRDANGDFAARKLTLSSASAADILKLGAAQIGWDGTNVTFNAPISAATISLVGAYQFRTTGGNVELYSGTANVWASSGNTLIVGALQLTGQSGVLKADVSGNVTGSATTDDLSEGATNLYYTTARVNSAADARITLQKGAVNGLASLDGSGKLTTAQIPTSLVGAVVYQGTWNATTNSPSLSSGTGTKGFYYVVSVAGATTLDGISEWAIGDWAIFNGTAWQKVDNTDAVSSVNSLTGAVVLTTTNIAEGTNLYYTDARVRACVLTGLSTGSGGTISATDTVLQALGKTQNRLAAIEAWTTTNLAEGANLYYTDARVRACVLTGLSTGSGGTVSASDTILAAIGKIENRLALDDAKVTGSDRALKAGDTFTGAVVMQPTAATSGTGPAILTLTGAGHTTLTASTECIDLYVNLNRVVQFNTGALTTQRAIDITAPKYAFVAASTLTAAVTLQIEGAPIGWTNATITNAYALKIAAGGLSGTTNGFGLYVDAPTGATNNYGLIVASGNVGIGTAAPTAVLDISADKLRLRTAKTPSSAADTGNAGDICWDSGFVYVCVATNSWKRAAITAW